MKMFVDEKWRDGARNIEVTSPWSGETLDTVPDADDAAAEAALASAARGARVMARMTAHDRYQILMRAANLCAAQAEQLAQTLSAETGKPITEARTEAGRGAELLRLAAFEGSQLRGETLPLDAAPNAADKFGFTVRAPCGVVVAITPFNFPLLLVLHKIAPALACGNAVVLKPASTTPLCALRLTEILLEAGLPANALQCITGGGAVLGRKLCADARVRKISFTGSTAVGEAITACAGIKKLSLELGSASPTLVMADADIEQAAAATAVGGYVNAGQVCISLQRVLVERRVYADYLDAVRAPVEGITVGAPDSEATALSAMIAEHEAARVEGWVNEAVAGGARLVTGGGRSGAVLQPTVVADVTPGMRLFSDEVFGPAVAVTPVEDFADALRHANDSKYGLSASLFTRDLTAGIRFARAVESGNVHLNWTPLWRADLMPYGGVKNSGIGREGVRYAVEEMTEVKNIVVHGVGVGDVG